MSITARVQGVFDDTKAGQRLMTAAESLRQRAKTWHWTNVFGIVTMASMAVLLVSGVILMFFYAPSSERVTYEGGYAPLHGLEMSKALASTLGISFDLPGGLLLRQAHHWAALLLPAAIIGQLVVTFFTGAFRGKRQWSWALLFVILIVALAAGWSGYALPDDMLSGTGLRIVQGIMLGIPVVGTWLAALLFGGEFPGRIIENLYVVHLAVSVALIVLLALRVRMAWTQAVVSIRDASRRYSTSLRVFFVAVAVLLVISATVTISPVWLYGPSSAGDVSAGSQPDWYTGFLDGALRLVPPGWELEIFGGTLTLAVLVPLAVIGAFLLAVLVYPFLENWVLRGRSERTMDVAAIDRPRNVPTRTAIGVAGMTFYGVLWGAASSDVLSHQLRLGLETVIIAFQVLLFIGPPIAFEITRRICIGLQRKDRDILAHGYETGRIVRLPGGEYVEVHRPVDAASRYRYAGTLAAPLMLRPDEHGRILLRDRARVLLQRAFYADRLDSPLAEAVEASQPLEDANH